MEVTPKPHGEEPSLRAEEILAALDEDQRTVALATRGPVCVIAGAGTGKTRAITHRIAYAAAIGTMEPSKVLALTFTCLLYTSPSPRDRQKSRMPSSA